MSLDAGRRAGSIASIFFVKESSDEWRWLRELQCGANLAPGLIANYNRNLPPRLKSPRSRYPMCCVKSFSDLFRREESLIFRVGKFRSRSHRADHRSNGNSSIPPFPFSSIPFLGRHFKTLESFSLIEVQIQKGGRRNGSGRFFVGTQVKVQEGATPRRSFGVIWAFRIFGRLSSGPECFFARSTTNFAPHFVVFDFVFVLAVWASNDEWHGLASVNNSVILGLVLSEFK